MPPKIKVCKEDILQAGVDIVRKEGADRLNARAVAAALGCSTQPVFSNYATMEELRIAVAERAESISRDYIEQEVKTEQYPPYKASGMAYIRFAREEQELFKLLYMRDRTAEIIPQETALGNEMESLVHGNTGLEGTSLKLFHLEMWAYVHGIATMIATGYLNLSMELVSQMLTDAYQGLKKHYEMR